VKLTDPEAGGATNLAKHVPAAGPEATRLHTAEGANEPEVLVKVTVPVGEEPVTVAVQIVDEPPVGSEGLQTTATVVGAVPLLTVN
jgi:hypothetical protein